MSRMGPSIAASASAFGMIAAAALKKDSRESKGANGCFSRISTVCSSTALMLSVASAASLPRGESFMSSADVALGNFRRTGSQDRGGLPGPIEGVQRLEYVLRNGGDEVYRIGRGVERLRLERFGDDEGVGRRGLRGCRACRQARPDGQGRGPCELHKHALTPSERDRATLSRALPCTQHEAMQQNFAKRTRLRS